MATYQAAPSLKPAVNATQRARARDGGWYLGALVDRFSRQVMGWSMGSRIDTSLVLLEGCHSQRPTGALEPQGRFRRDWSRRLCGVNPVVHQHRERAVKHEQ